MKTNKQISQKIIIEKIRNNSLIIYKSQLVVPLSCFRKDMNNFDWVKLAIQSRAYYNVKYNMSKIAIKSLKASLNEYNMANIVDRYDLEDDCLYVNIHEAEIISGLKFEYPDLFEKYLTSHNFSNDIEEFKFYCNKFFKHTKMFLMLIPEHIEENVESSWCCEDCDGTYENLVEFTIETERTKIKDKLKQFKYYE